MDNSDKEFLAQAYKSFQKAYDDNFKKTCPDCTAKDKEIADLKEQLSTAAAWHSSEVDRADALQSQLDNISEDNVTNKLKEFGVQDKYLSDYTSMNNPKFTTIKVSDVAKAIIKLRGE